MTRRNMMLICEKIKNLESGLRNGGSISMLNILNTMSTSKYKLHFQSWLQLYIVFGYAFRSNTMPFGDIKVQADISNLFFYIYIDISNLYLFLFFSFEVFRNSLFNIIQISFCPYELFIKDYLYINLIK